MNDADHDMLIRIDENVIILSNNMNELKERLCKLEGKPARRMDSIVTSIISAAVSFAVSIFTGRVK